MKRIWLILPLLLTTLVYSQSKVDINDLVEVDGKIYKPMSDELYSGIVYDLYSGTDKKKLEGFYRDGLKNGKWTWWNVFGGIDSTGSFRKGLFYGQWKYYHSNGQLKAKGNYRNGDGTNRDEYGLTSHGRHGKWTFWYEDGMQASEITYKEGEIVGNWTSWNEQGQKVWEGTQDEYQAEVLIYDRYNTLIARQAIKSKTGPSSSIVDNDKKADEEKLLLIPNLIGVSLRSAEITLQQAGLMIDTVYTEYNPEYPKGTIAWQYPKANDTMKKGLGLQVTVSQGLPPNFYQVPNVIGLSLNKAKEHLSNARLKTGRITYHEDQDLVPYTVLDQSIPAATVLEEPSFIDLTISVLDIQDIFRDNPADLAEKQAAEAEKERLAAEAAKKAEEVGEFGRKLSILNGRSIWTRGASFTDIRKLEALGLTVEADPISSQVNKAIFIECPDFNRNTAINIIKYLGYQVLDFNIYIDETNECGTYFEIRIYY